MHEPRVIGHGPVNSIEQLKDLVATHKRDGYIKHVTAKTVSHYWELDFPVIVIEEMPDMRGSALILYTGTQESFWSWQREIMQALERAADTRGKIPGRLFQ